MLIRASNTLHGLPSPSASTTVHTLFLQLAPSGRVHYRTSKVRSDYSEVFAELIRDEMPHT